MKNNDFIENIKTLNNKKEFIYLVRIIGWILVPAFIFTFAFNFEFFERYPILKLFFIFPIFLQDYKANYKEMKFSKRMWLLLIDLSFLFGCIYVASVLVT